MSRSLVNVVDDAPQIQTWNRTPGKPNPSNLPEAASWGAKKKAIHNAASSDAAADKSAWPLLSELSLSTKDDPSQWSASAELTGASLDDSVNDFSIPNSWNAPGTSLALRALGDANDLNDPWPPLDTNQSSNPIDSASTSHAITDNGHLVSNENALNLCSRIHNTTGGDQGFSGWATAVDDQLPSNTKKNIENFQQPTDALGLSANDSDNRIDVRSEASGIISTLINSKECWCRRPVNQTTFWDIVPPNEESASLSETQTSTGILGDAISLTIKRRRSNRGINNSNASIESNVWSSEPPTGTGIWQMHYEGLGDGAGLWKQPSSSSTAGVGMTDGSGDVASPSGSHRLVPSFINPSVQQPHQGRGSFKNHFFPSQSQPRFNQAAPQSASGLARGVIGPNSVLGAATAVGSAFKLQPSAGWSFSLTPDGQSPLDDTKRLLMSSGPWGSEGRALGKQQQQALSDTTRWPSPLGPPSASTDGIPSPIFASPPPWQGGMDAHKCAPWSQQTAMASQPPLSAVPQRFHFRQNTSGMPIASASSTQPMQLLPSANHLTNAQHVSSFTNSLRTDIAKQLMVLGLHDDAVVFLSDNSIEDFEHFLYGIRERTGGMYPGLNKLIHSVSTVMTGSGFGPTELQQQQQLGLPPPQTFDLFDSRGSSAALHMNKAHLAGRHNSSSPSEVLNQLLMRESHLQSAITQLDKKKRELSMRHLQLRKMNMDSSTAQHSNPILQEIAMQQAQISRQIEAQEAQLDQVRLQIAFLTHITTGGAANDDSNTAASTAMLMRLRSGGGGNNASSNRMTNHPVGAFNSRGGPRGIGMLPNSSAPADLALRLANLKVSMNMGHQTPWEGGGSSGVSGWDVPSPQQFNHSSPSSAIHNNDPTFNVFPFTSSNLGDRRWTTYNASSDFNQLSTPSPTTTAEAVANAIWNVSWLLLSDLTPQFSLEVLGISIATALDQHQNGVIGKSGCSASITGTASSAYKVHPNLAARYVLIGFLNHADASIVSAFISAANSTIKLANSVAMISPAEAVVKLQEIKA